MFLFHKHVLPKSFPYMQKTSESVIASTSHFHQRPRARLASPFVCSLFCFLSDPLPFDGNMDDTGSNIGIPLQPSLSDYTPQTTGITSHSVHILTIHIVTMHIFQLADDNLTVTYSMCFNPNKQKLHSISFLQPWRPITK